MSQPPRPGAARAPEPLASHPMRFSIITPSFRNSEWLKLCVASVADQSVPLEHLVQDSCSEDGTQDWLPRDPRVRAFIEKDLGMYDAVNRGLRRATGDLLAYLNCDEQYLPGALATVADYFARNPGIEVAFADTVVVTPTGDYLCHRRASVPGKYHTLTSGDLSIFTCATFFRRSLIERRGLFFNPKVKAVGDVEWALSLLEHNVPMGVLPRLTSVFTETGGNLGLHPDSQRERAAIWVRAPVWARSARALFLAHYRLRRLCAGHYHSKPFSFSLYTKKSPAVRVPVSVDKPTTRWIRWAAPVAEAHDMSGS